MKMMFKLTAAVLALGAIMLAPTNTFADGCTKTTNAIEAKKISGKTHCTPTDAKACADKLGMSFEECQKLCATGNHELVQLAVAGMTGTGCEKAITTCLEGLQGVKKVGLVNHQEGTAFVLVDTDVATYKSLEKAVLSKGYQAEIIPAVAKGSVDAKTVNASDTKAAGCGTMVQKACAKKCATPCGAKKTADKKDESGS